MTARVLQQVIESIPASDGAGVKLRRSIGKTPHARLDPFLMLDEFSSDDPNDYIAGFPAHPHRGFETVTYMLDGHMRHEDHLGNRGDLKAGGVQWMTAGRGIVHSEMPQQTQGRMRGFQLWINLPAAEKMKPAAYRDIEPDEIPCVALPGGGQARVIAGSLQIDGREIAGPIRGLTTEPLYVDIELNPGELFMQRITSARNVFLYPFEGSVIVDPNATARRLARQHAGVLGDGDDVVLRAADEKARVLLLAGRPLREPIVQYGPFVMNTREEIEQALRDFQRGAFA